MCIYQAENYTAMSRRAANIITAQVIYKPNCVLGLATGGIGGTYAVMPELFLKVWDLVHAGEAARAAQVQNEICRIIYAMCAAKGNLYAVMKAILKDQYGLELGGVRAPLPDLAREDASVVAACSRQIKDAVAKYC